MSKNDKIIRDSSTLGQFSGAISQICEEKGLEKDKVIEAVEMALAAAYKKDYGRKGQIIVAKLDGKTGEVNFKRFIEVVDETTRNLENLEKLKEKEDDGEGEKEDTKKDEFKKAKKSKEVVIKGQEIIEEKDDEHLTKFNKEKDILLSDAQKIEDDIQIGDFIEIPLETKSDYGRVASQTAKQVIIQRLREAERDAMYDEYKGKEGEVVNGTVQRVEGRNVIIDLGKSVGVLFPSGQIPGENYQIGQRLRVFIEKVESEPRGPGIILSRTSPELMEKLFELEVPEIFSGSVEIKAVSREPGSRSKIAVISNEEGLDPIGSCVGQKGTRVQAVIDELNGEKIDIIEWNDNIEKMIASALAPAKIVKVDIKESKKAIAFVPQDQLSLAIGRSGQNVRLAVKLTGWKIDVLSLDEQIGGKEKEAKTKDREAKKETEKKEAEKDLSEMETKSHGAGEKRGKKEKKAAAKSEEDKKEKEGKGKKEGKKSK